MGRAFWHIANGYSHNKAKYLNILPPSIQDPSSSVLEPLAQPSFYALSPPFQTFSNKSASLSIISLLVAQPLSWSSVTGVRTVVLLSDIAVQPFSDCQAFLYGHLPCAFVPEIKKMSETFFFLLAFSSVNSTRFPFIETWQ
jgi:hypothetical protein